jgi:hypothetical protein
MQAVLVERVLQASRASAASQDGPYGLQASTACPAYMKLACLPVKSTVDQVLCAVEHRNSLK